MNNLFCQKVEEILKNDQRYKADAYEFIMHALWFTQKKLERKGHVSCNELLDGIKAYGLAEYGPLAKTVFSHWGIHKTDDFGEIVFNMIESGLMGRTEQDSKEDFKDVYDFNEALNAFREGI